MKLPLGWSWPYLNMEALSAFGPAGAAVGIVWIFIRYMSPTVDRLANSIDKNTQVTNETYKFLKNLNGDLKKVVDKKRK